MERIRFIYDREDDCDSNFREGHAESLIRDKANRGLNLYDICETFVSFLESAGFSGKEITRYFEN